jgi:hypothetical protein
MTFEATLQHLQKELADATERIKVLDDMNSTLALNAAKYRVDWINEYRRAEVAEHENGEACGRGISQADWDAPSPY